MTAGVNSDARLYLTDLEQNGGESVCTFDYFLSGIPFCPPAATARRVRFRYIHCAGPAGAARLYADDADAFRSSARAGGGDSAGGKRASSGLQRHVRRNYCRLAVVTGGGACLFQNQKSDSADSGAGNYRASACGGSDAGGKSRQRKRRSMKSSKRSMKATGSASTLPAFLPARRSTASSWKTPTQKPAAQALLGGKAAEEEAPARMLAQYSAGSSTLQLSRSGQLEGRFHRRLGGARSDARNQTVSALDGL